MNKYWMVGLGGFLGSIARFWLGGYISNRMGARFPYGTFVINITRIVSDRTDRDPARGTNALERELALLDPDWIHRGVHDLFHV